MLDGDNKQNFYSLMQLRDLVVDGSRHLVIWVGAGTSRWCHYPSWDELARELHTLFSRSEASYDRTLGATLIANSDLPKLFSLCKNSDAALYHKTLASAFLPRPTTPVYDNFLNLISSLRPMCVVTTNVDEALEQHIPTATIVQRSDFQRCLPYLNQGQPFICKLHGSISAVEQTVFTVEDYEKLQNDPAYLGLLRHIFAESAIVFLGYGLKDEYVLKTIRELDPSLRIFGNGPHFVATASSISDLPDSILPIQYLVGKNKDHRAAIEVLDIIIAAKAGKLSRVPVNEVTTSASELQSGYFISDFTPTGTWTSSQTLQLGRSDGSFFYAIVGHGLINSELPNFHSHSPRDFIVGLLCFDKVYLPLTSLAVMHDYLGSQAFWELVKEDALRFVHLTAQPSYIYDNQEALTSVDVALMGLGGKSGALLTAREDIRRQLKAQPGNESAAEALMARLESKVHVFDCEGWEIPRLIRGALLHPRLRRLIGLSDGIFPTAIPRWLVFPCLRVAHTISTAAVCQQFNLAAANIWFGGEILVGATFGLAAAGDWAHEAASYVMASESDVDLGGAFDLSVLETILKFRNTPEGVTLRKDVLDQLRVNAGSEFIASVNAGMKRSLPFASLEKPRRTFATLMAKGSGNSRLTRAISYNPLYSDKSLSLWRKRSLNELRAVCAAKHIGTYDLCPCGSGEKLKFCCLEALKSED